MLEDCESTIEELKVIIEKVLSKGGSSRLTRGWKAITSLGQDRKVEEIGQSIWRNIPLLIYHHVGSLTADIAGMRLPEPAGMTQFMVPVQWADDFTGRETQLGFLASTLCQPERHARVAVVGLGRIGYLTLCPGFSWTYPNLCVSHERLRHLISYLLLVMRVMMSSMI